MEQQNAERNQPEREAPKLLYDRRSAADLLSISVRKFDELLARHEITPTRIDGRVLVSWNELLRFVDSREKDR